MSLLIKKISFATQIGVFTAPFKRVSLLLFVRSSYEESYFSLKEIQTRERNFSRESSPLLFSLRTYWTFGIITLCLLE